MSSPIDILASCSFEFGLTHTMTLSARQEQIVVLFRQHGSMTIDALADHFAVAPQTIRRDINTLCDAAVLQRQHGGAKLIQPSLNQPYDIRAVRNLEGKVRIGLTAAQLIPNGSSVLIGIGTTPEQCAIALMQHENLAVITNNLRAALALVAQPGHRVIIAGGELRAPNPEVLGAEVEKMFRGYRADYGIYGVGGVDDDGTLLDYDRQEAASRHALRDNCRCRILVVDSSKFTRKPSVRGGHLTDPDILVTDADLPEHLDTMLRDRVRVVVAR
jgi:DeoR family glycerol-3-phosphate regulon repressor